MRGAQVVGSSSKKRKEVLGNFEGTCNLLKSAQARLSLPALNHGNKTWINTCDVRELALLQTRYRPKYLDCFAIIHVAFDCKQLELGLPERPLSTQL